MSSVQHIAKNYQMANERYIYIEKFPCENKEINKYLLQYPEQLITRRILKFNLNNWFEWSGRQEIFRL